MIREWNVPYVFTHFSSKSVSIFGVCVCVGAGGGGDTQDYYVYYTFWSTVYQTWRDLIG